MGKKVRKLDKIVMEALIVLDSRLSVLETREADRSHFKATFAKMAHEKLHEGIVATRACRSSCEMPKRGRGRPRKVRDNNYGL